MVCLDQEPRQVGLPRSRISYRPFRTRMLIAIRTMTLIIARKGAHIGDTSFLASDQFGASRETVRPSHFWSKPLVPDREKILLRARRHKCFSSGKRLEKGPWSCGQGARASSLGATDRG